MKKRPLGGAIEQACCLACLLFPGFGLLDFLPQFPVPVTPLSVPYLSWVIGAVHGHGQSSGQLQMLAQSVESPSQVMPLDGHEC